MKSFDFFSLDYIYYPVSGIMWVWHKIFVALLPHGATNGWAWVLSVMFLVFTLRSLLFKPFMGQMNSQMKMQAVAPELKKLRDKYKDDKTRLAEEMQKFNKEAGVNPLGGCLPALIQAPVFIGLFHVLKEFRPNQGENYFFGASDVASFVNSKLFGGAPLSAFMTMPLHTTVKQVGLSELGGVRSTVIAVGIPLTILAGIATFLTSRRSVARQQQMQGTNEPAPQAAIMNKLMKYVFPLFVVVGGPFFPLAILFYWLSNNTWTFGQLTVAHRLQDRKLAAQSMVVNEAREAAKFTKPPPGAKPLATRPSPGARPATRSSTGAKRPIVQPSSTTQGNGKTPVVDPTNGSSRTNKTVKAKGATPVNGAAGSNGVSGATRATGSNGVAANGATRTNGVPAAGETPNGRGPSLRKVADVAGSSGSTRADLPPGTISDATKPKPTASTARKKKPGRR